MKRQRKKKIITKWRRENTKWNHKMNFYNRFVCLGKKILFSLFETRFSHKLNVKQIFKKTNLQLKCCGPDIFSHFITMNIIYAILLLYMWNKTESFNIIMFGCCVVVLWICICVCVCCSQQSELLLIMKRCDLVRTKQQDKVKRHTTRRSETSFHNFSSYAAYIFRSN